MRFLIKNLKQNVSEQKFLLKALTVSVTHLEKKLNSLENEKGPVRKINVELMERYGEQMKLEKVCEEAFKKRSYFFRSDSDMYQQGFSEAGFQRGICGALLQQISCIENGDNIPS